MAIKGELKGFDGTYCDCGRSLPLKVCQSAAGYYLGYECSDCGPYSRETGYYVTRQEAEADLAKEQPEKARDTLYQPGELEFETFEELANYLKDIRTNEH